MASITMIPSMALIKRRARENYNAADAFCVSSARAKSIVKQRRIAGDEGSVTEDQRTNDRDDQIN